MWFELDLRMWIYFPQCFLIAQMTTYFLKKDFYFVLKLVIEYFKGSPLGECRANGIGKPCFLSCWEDFHIRLALDCSLQSRVLYKFLTMEILLKGKIFFFLCNLILSCELDFNWAVVIWLFLPNLIIINSDILQLITAFDSLVHM